MTDLMVKLPLEKLKAFEGWEAVLNEWLIVAMRLSLQDLKVVANRNTYERFAHSSGDLESHFRQPLISTSFPILEGAMLNDSPYAWRREEGFSGMTDSLGRFYPNDPGVHYMADTAESEREWVRKKFQWAVNRALKELVANTGGA